MQLVIKRLYYLFFKADELLLANLDTPLVLHQSDHTVKARWNGLLQLRWHQSANNGQANQAWRFLSSYGYVDEVSIRETARQIKCLLLVGLESVKFLKKRDHVMACLFSDLDSRILQVDVIADCVLVAKHLLVAALRKFRCKLAFMSRIWISFLRNVEKVDCGKHVLNFCLPAARHLLRRIYEFQVLDYLKGTILCGSQVLERATALEVFVASHACWIVILRADCKSDWIILRRWRPLSNRCDLELTGGVPDSLCALKAGSLSNWQLGLASALASTQVALFECFHSVQVLGDLALALLVAH